MDNSPPGEGATDKPFLDMNNIALYALGNGAPFFAYRHSVFIARYMKARQGRGNNALSFSGTSFRWPQQSTAEILMAVLLPVRRIPAVIKLSIMLIPLTLSVTRGNYNAILNSFPNLMTKSVRSIPPLITAVVVVFITRDAWGILGAGFTLRFFLLVGAFLLASLFVLVRKDYWADLGVAKNEVNILLRKATCQASVNRLIRMGADPLPIIKPDGLGGRMNFLAIYLMYTLMSLIAVAVSVSLCLMAVGVILVNARETEDLAGSVNVVLTVHGSFVITRQLLSLSFSLGAFATFFLVAGQRNEERQAFMRHMLSKLRCTLLIYAVYCRAYDHAPTWTGIGALSRDSEAGGHDLQSSLSHRGRPTSWVAVAIIITGFIVGGIAMVAGPVWWLFLTGAAIIATGGVFALSWRIFDDWY